MSSDTQRMSFVQPVWESASSQYVIKLSPAFNESSRVSISKDSTGSTVFSDLDHLESITETVVHNLIEEGSSGNWFSKLPSHAQLMKRVRHTFGELAVDSKNAAILTSVLLTPKQLTFVWNPITHMNPSPPRIEFEDSSESSAGEEVSVSESNLPPVTLSDDTQQTQEEYLLTRLRAAKARVEAEQIRMQYFETTGRMPPDSDSEDE
jgi:hypothetical protein